MPPRPAPARRTLGPFTLGRRLPLHRPLRSLEFWRATRDDGTEALVAAPQQGLETIASFAAWASAFEADVDAAQQLDHPALLRVRERERSQGVPFAVFEAFDGVSLRDVWPARADVECFPPLVAALVVERVAAAVDHVHGAARERGERDAVTYLDEGVVLCGIDGSARVLPSFLHVLEEEMPSLVEPPRLLGLPPTDRQPTVRSVVFALGSALYQLAAGRLLVGAGDPWPRLTELTARFPRPSHRNPSLSVLDEVIAKATHAEPSRRYADPGRLAAALAQLLCNGEDAVPSVGYREAAWTVERAQRYLAERVRDAIAADARG